MSTHTSQHAGCSGAATVTELRPGRALPGNDERGIFDSIIELAPGPDNPTPMVRVSRRMNPHADLEVLVKL
ncbi:MAG TPA: hypothetical protein VLS87_05640, partial [Woeseiaceae bacterium]|nr:hypothetical protein [Woeseiaceae bacterium]